MGSKSKYKVQFQDLEHSKVPTKQSSKKKQSQKRQRTSNKSQGERSTSYRGKRKSVDTNYKSCRSGSLGKSVSLGISSSTKKRSSVGRKSITTICSSQKKRLLNKSLVNNDTNSQIGSTSAHKRKKSSLNRSVNSKTRSRAKISRTSRNTK